MRGIQRLPFCIHAGMGGALMGKSPSHALRPHPYLHMTMSICYLSSAYAGG